MEVAQAPDSAGMAASSLPESGAVASNGNPTPAGIASQAGNGSSPGPNGQPMTSEGEHPPPASPDPQGTPQPPQPQRAPEPQGVPQPAPPGQPQAAPPGYVQGQGMPPQPPPGYAGYPGYPAYPPQPGGPYERRGLIRAWYEYPALRWLTIILALALIALLVWLLAFKSEGSSSATVQPGGGPVGVTQQDLVALSQRLNQPIYWAGTVSGTRMELTETSSSYAYLRYLSSDAPIGDASPNFLTVGTYPQLNAFKNLSSYAKHNQANTERIDNGGIAVTIPHSPTSVYFAFPNQDVQVEVYDPQPGQALNMVKSGQVVPVPGGVTTSNGTAPVPTQGTAGSVPTPAAPTSATPTTTPTTPSATPTTPTVPGG